MKDARRGELDTVLHSCTRSTSMIFPF